MANALSNFMNSMKASLLVDMIVNVGSKNTLRDISLVDMHTNMFVLA